MEYYKNLSLENIIYTNDNGDVCEEVWKDIPEYEGMYQVSDLGNVKSLERKNMKKEKILKKTISKTGYFTVSISNKIIVKTFKVHQLVAMAFLGHTPSGYKIVVDHIDNNPLNNCLSNLQLISQRDNVAKEKNKSKNKYTGVVYCKHNKKIKASIFIENKTINLGYYKTEYEAYLAYEKAKKDWEENKIKPLPKKFSSKYKGVSFNNKRNKWESFIQINKKKINLGRYNSEQEAYLATINYEK